MKFQLSIYIFSWDIFSWDIGESKKSGKLIFCFLLSVNKFLDLNTIDQTLVIIKPSHLHSFQGKYANYTSSFKICILWYADC